MTDLPVSVVVVSWQRPDALRRCLIGLSQLQYPNFEIVVVADAPSHFAFADVKWITVDQANISVARNLGIAAAAGEIVAFIDDDAVPEPTWLSFLIKPFQDASIAATGGYVRGRNGISWQWRGRVVNQLGVTRDHRPGDAVPEGWAIKTEGTNMAVRRDVLVDVGGFDPAYRFFLDETDLNLRLTAGGHRTELVPQAEVHHGFLASARRRNDRVPLDLFQIGASWAHFLRKFAPDSEHIPRMREIIALENKRLLSHLVQGGLEPRDVLRLRLTLQRGLDTPASDVSNVTNFAPRNMLEFQRYPSRTRQSVVLACRPMTAQKTRKEAENRVKDGEIVTVFNLSATSVYHYQKFTNQGVWEQYGGVYGKSDRAHPMVKFWRRSDRILAETKRISVARNVII